ncbi:MAG: hypothetical protein P8Y25_15135 [Chromatiaceae bacterium]
MRVYIITGFVPVGDKPSFPLVLAPKLRLGRSIPEALLPRNRRWLTERLDEAELRKRPYRMRIAHTGVGGYSCHGTTPGADMS